MNNKIFETTRNKLNYVGIKLGNMAHAFYVNSALTSLVATTEEAERAADLSSYMLLLAENGVIECEKDCEIIKIAVSLNDEFRTNFKY